MICNNEISLDPSQIHFLRCLLDGKREISEKEASARAKKLQLEELLLPCAVICVSPFFSGIDYDRKDELIGECSEYLCRFFHQKDYKYYCLSNTYDNYQIILPTEGNGITVYVIEEQLIKFHEKFKQHFDLDLFIGIGSEVGSLTDISRSALEAMETLAYKNRYADRGVINIINTSRFEHYAIYGEDIMFARVIGRFQDGDLGMMAVRLDELIESVRKRPGVSKTAIRRTFIELAVNILHIASNADVDVDSVLGGVEVYNWVLRQNHTEVLREWLLGLSEKLMRQMEDRQQSEEKNIIRQACDYISEYLSDQKLSLKTISEEVGLSSAYFSQLFKLEKGIGLNNYITESRIEFAKHLLSSTDLKNEEVALRSGFSTSTYFGRVFKKNTGLTPCEFRTRSRIAPDKEQ